MKNPQTTIALPFLTHNNSAIGGVMYVLHTVFACITVYLSLKSNFLSSQVDSHSFSPSSLTLHKAK